MDAEHMEWLATQIVDAAIKVHRALGPGLLESVYKKALKRELELRGISVREEVPVYLNYEDVDVGKGFEIDLLVEDEIIIETKAKDSLVPVDMAQMITHLKLYDRHLGFLINFNVTLLKFGLKRIVYKYSYFSGTEITVSKMPPDTAD
jgi:GxxExxY protein